MIEGNVWQKSSGGEIGVLGVMIRTGGGGDSATSGVERWVGSSSAAATEKVTTDGTTNWNARVGTMSVVVRSDGNLVATLDRRLKVKSVVVRSDVNLVATLDGRSKVKSVVVRSDVNLVATLDGRSKVNVGVRSDVNLVATLDGRSKVNVVAKMIVQVVYPVAKEMEVWIGTQTIVPSQSLLYAPETRSETWCLYELAFTSINLELALSL